MILTDQIRRQISVNTPALRIISLVPSITETLYQIGAGAQVVGRTKFCIEPARKVNSSSIVGGTKSFHRDKIDALRPDLVLANKEENDQNAIEALAQDYPVWVGDVKDLEDALDLITTLGILSGKDQTAKQFNQEIVEAFDWEPPGQYTAIYLIWQNPLMVSGGDTFIHHMMQRAGLVNLFAHASRYPSISENDLFEANPDVVLLSSEPFPFKTRHVARFQTLLPNSKVLLCDGTYFSWYGSRLLHAPEYFSSLHSKLSKM